MTIVQFLPVLWEEHRRDNAKPKKYRYIHMMVSYDELSRTTE